MLSHWELDTALADLEGDLEFVLQNLPTSAGPDIREHLNRAGEFLHEAQRLVQLGTHPGVSPSEATLTLDLDPNATPPPPTEGQ